MRTLASFVARGFCLTLLACGASPGTAAEPDAADLPRIDAGAAREAAAPDALPDLPDATNDAVDAGGEFDAASCTRIGASGTCGLAPQCGCAPNQTCDVDDDLDTVCVGPAGNNLEGNICVNTASCALGLSCAIGGTCHAFCTTPGEACAGERQGECVQIVDANDAAVPGLAVCEIACALQDSDACGPDAACYPSGATEGTDCGRAGTVEAGGECRYLSDCQAGYGCVGPADQKRRCKRWCRVGRDDCASQSCAPLNPALVINNVTYGTCP